MAVITFINIFFLNKFSGALRNQKQIALGVNPLSFEYYQIKFWTERNLVKGGANPGNRTRKPPIVAGALMSVSRMGQNFIFP